MLAGAFAALVAVVVAADGYPSVSEAVSDCAARGGGTVTVARGLHVSHGPIVLKSNVELRLEKGATILFSDNPGDYLPGVPVSIEGVECYNVSPLVYACGCTNIAITGEGELKAKMDFWWSWAGLRKPACQDANRKLKNEWAPKNVPVKDRQLWREPGAEFRPQFLHFNRCRNVRLEGFSVRGTPFWTIHVFLCDGVTARNLSVDATGDDGRMINNSDGFDIDSTRNVLVENCTFCQGDDAIVFKSGKDFDGRRLATPTENVVVRGCTVRRGHNLAAVGSELSGGIRNVRISDCRVVGSVGNLLHVKTNPRRGGFVANVSIDNVEADELSHAVLGVATRYYFGSPGEESLPEDCFTSIRDISIRNVRCRKASRRLYLSGDYRRPVENVTLDNVVVETLSGADYIANADNLCIDGVATPPTATALPASELGAADLSAAVWRPETREYVLALTDGTVRGTVVRSSRDREIWSEPFSSLCPEDEWMGERVRSVRIRRDASGWYMDIVFASAARTYFTPEIFWPFRPKSFFK